MARYNSSLASNSINGATTIGSPYSGAFTELTGTAPYTVTLPSPVAFPGSNQTFYNATSGTITLNTPSGTFNGTGGTSTANVSCYAGNVVSVTSDGTNYIVISEDGSALVATSGTFSSDVSISGTLTVQPSGGVTIGPGSTGSINNVSIGATTRSSGAFTTLAANGAVTFTANTASSSTSTGTLVITGGLGVSGAINATSVSGSLTGTIQTAAQPNITSVGTLTGLKVGAGSTGIVLASAGNSAAYDDIKISYSGYNSGQPITSIQPNTTPGSGVLTSYTYFRNSNGTSGSANNLHAVQIDSSLAVNISGLGISTGLGTPLYVYKDASNITNGGQEANGAALFGKAQTTGDISVFVGADQGTTKYGYVGAVNRGTSYVPLVLQPAGGAVGIGVILNPANTMLHVKGDWVGGHSTIKVQTTTAVGSGGTTGMGFYDSDASRRSIIYSNSNAGLNFETSGSTAQNFYIAGVLKLQLDTSGHLIPGADAVSNLGSPTVRWNNIYTADMHFSNENTEGNSVDGTTGNWTLQEGENDIYMLNNKTGKRYKIKLEEV